MNDEALGRLAKALLADLDGIHGVEGKVIAVARVIAHARECGREEALSASENTVAWKDPVTQIERGKELADLQEKGVEVPKRERPRAPSLDDVVRCATAANAASMRLIEQAPGPTTRYARALLLAALPAQFAAQCGERTEFARVMYWLADACFGLHNSAPEGMSPSESIFDVIGGLALIGAMTDPRCTEYDPEMMIAIARRTVSNLASIARAAARMEGRAECDQIFWIGDSITSSARGLEPHQARLCAAQLAAHVGATRIATVRPDDIAKHRAHIAKLKLERGDGNAYPKNSIAERSVRSGNLRDAAVQAARSGRPARN